MSSSAPPPPDPNQQLSTSSSSSCGGGSGSGSVRASKRAKASDSDGVHHLGLDHPDSASAPDGTLKTRRCAARPALSQRRAASGPAPLSSLTDTTFNNQQTVPPSPSSLRPSRGMARRATSTNTLTRSSLGESSQFGNLPSPPEDPHSSGAEPWRRIPLAEIPLWIANARSDATMSESTENHGNMDMSIEAGPSTAPVTPSTRRSRRGPLLSREVPAGQRALRSRRSQGQGSANEPFVLSSPQTPSRRAILPNHQVELESPTAVRSSSARMSARTTTLRPGLRGTAHRTATPSRTASSREAQTGPAGPLQGSYWLRSSGPGSALPPVTPSRSVLPGDVQESPTLSTPSLVPDTPATPAGPNSRHIHAHTSPNSSLPATPADATRLSRPRTRSSELATFARDENNMSAENEEKVPDSVRPEIATALLRVDEWDGSV